MNSLSKIQLLMAAFLLLLFGAFLIDTLLIVPAVLLFALQLVIAKTGLKADYPEDWVKYTLVFLFYELAIVYVLYTTLTTRFSVFNMAALSNIFMLIFFILLVTMFLRYFVIGRKHCYGAVVFASGAWAGVAIKSDLFSRINGANYAVENPLNLKLKKGDRVKVLLTGGVFSKPAPNEITEVIK